ncbi:HNH endonuclease family protein [Pseudoglutamicibacter albus]|uniref:HNH endonuclease family protein n=1 Tax=Pseudoglutamicibacter albus TaxID=98671 RepID=UPI002543C1FC|nr:HNH endonuclease family protein [Pseudoglutamicibacter albus]WIK85014.1 HNH endonuclease family protein [Pseudoglutamicibacter albus]
MWAITEHGEDPEFLVAFFSKLERLAASMLVRRVYLTPRRQRYMELLKQLADGHGLDSHSFELTEIERAETLERLDGDIYLDTRVHKYVLLRLDSVLADDPGASYDHKIITVEHVLPQTIAPDSQWASNFTEEEAATWTHRLGNLLLLNRRKNSSAGNYDFDVKKERYFKSGKGVAVFALTTQVLGESVWTPSVIERRQQVLVETLIKEWQL